jgi:hypothetical protein
MQADYINLMAIFYTNPMQVVREVMDVHLNVQVTKRDMKMDVVFILKAQEQTANRKVLQI